MKIYTINGQKVIVHEDKLYIEVPSEFPSETAQEEKVEKKREYKKVSKSAQKMTSGMKLSPEQKRKLILDIKEGGSTNSELVEKYNQSAAVISYYRKKHDSDTGPVRHRQQISEETKQEIIGAFENNENTADISTRFEIKIGTIYNMRSRWDKEQKENSKDIEFPKIEDDLDQTPEDNEPTADPEDETKEYKCIVCGKFHKDAYYPGETVRCPDCLSLCTQV